MRIIETGRYRVRLAEGAEDRAAVQDLRARAFRGGAPDEDGFDRGCDHLMVEEPGAGVLRATCRLLPFATGSEIAGSYAAQFYDLTGLQGWDQPMLELGRVCTDPDAGSDGEVLRLAWAAVTAYGEARDVAFLFGCSSFPGVDPEPFASAFGLLQARHLAPAALRPAVRSEEVVRFQEMVGASPDMAQGTAALPPLLRAYLMMGGWVSDHAVVDRDLGTLHVFTGLETRAVPPARLKVLRAVLG